MKMLRIINNTKCLFFDDDNIVNHIYETECWTMTTNNFNHTRDIMLNCIKHIVNDAETNLNIDIGNKYYRN